MPPSTQSWAEMRTDIGRSLGPGGAHGGKHFQRVAQAVGQRAAVVVARWLVSGEMKLDSR
jgi:hypothetical protein